MAIINIRVFTRADSATPFFHETTIDEHTAYLSAISSLVDSGAIVKTNVINENTLTATTTCDSLESFSALDTAVGVAYDNAFVNYMEANNIMFESYTLTGIDQPFTMTTVYTAPSAGLPYFTAFQQGMASSNNLVSVTATSDTVITAVHQFATADEFTAHGFPDRTSLTGLQEHEITRDITYALVTSA
jgi:hypothetical protein